MKRGGRATFDGEDDDDDGILFADDNVEVLAFSGDDGRLSSPLALAFSIFILFAYFYVERVSFMKDD